MGAPMIEDERLYSFFDEFKANMHADVETSKGLYLQEKQQLNDELSTFSSAYTVPGQNPELSEYQLDNGKILRHITDCFTKGVRSAKNLSLGKPPNVVSRLPYMHEERKAYEFFLFWLELPTNEWLDAFLFEVAASWKDITEHRELQEKLSIASNNLVTINISEFPSRDELQSYTAFNEKSVSELLDYISQYSERLHELQQLSKKMRSIIDSFKNSEFQISEEAQLSDDFFENQFLMRRVKENRKNIRTVKYALKDLGLEEIEPT